MVVFIEYKLQNSILTVWKSGYMLNVKPAFEWS